jgi:hypothetical protein
MGLPSRRFVKIIGWTNWLWEKWIFGFCRELWCFVVNSWDCWDCCRFPVVFTGFCGADFLREKCGEIVVNAWLNVETGWLSKTP